MAKNQALKGMISNMTPASATPQHLKFCCDCEYSEPMEAPQSTRSVQFKGKLNCIHSWTRDPVSGDPKSTTCEEMRADYRDNGRPTCGFDATLYQERTHTRWLELAEQVAAAKGD